MRAKHLSVPFAGLFSILALSSCSPDVSGLLVSAGDIEASKADMMGRVVTSIGRPDSAGLLGRNREWGSLYSVRFQYGAGRALRHGFATQNDQIAIEAKRAIEAGLSTIEASGAFPASVPDRIAKGRKPSISDQASAAAFFLSDVCPALSIAGSSAEDLERIEEAIFWLADRQTILLERDKAAPNRLFITALAFAGCGGLIDDKDMQERALNSP
jgi:hypothetical protein